LVNALSNNVSSDWELDLANVANGDRIGPARGLDHSAERAELAVLNVHAHLVRRVVGPVPELDVGIKRTALSAKNDLHLLY
jgi:hypothetical protein